MPITFRTGRVFPSGALIHIGEQTGMAMADQIATASKSRLVNRIGRLKPGDLAPMELAIANQLALTLPPAGYGRH